MHPYQKEMLTTALDARKKEVIEYQVNIDNFRLAIERIGDDVDLQDFKQKLSSNLEAARLEQRKAQIMLDVVSQQLEEEACTH